MKRRRYYEIFPKIKTSRVCVFIIVIFYKDILKAILNVIFYKDVLRAILNVIFYNKYCIQNTFFLYKIKLSFVFM